MSNKVLKFKDLIPVKFTPINDRDSKTSVISKTVRICMIYKFYHKFSLYQSLFSFGPVIICLVKNKKIKIEMNSVSINLYSKCGGNQNFIFGIQKFIIHCLKNNSKLLPIWTVWLSDHNLPHFWHNTSSDMWLFTWTFVKKMFFDFFNFLNNFLWIWRAIMKTKE